MCLTRVAYQHITLLLLRHPERFLGAFARQQWLFSCRATTMGRMFMVDLAGSERLKKSKSVGLRAQEAKAINLSLTTLGMCVNAKSDPTSTHIPFRDSKLTRLLQESLGGNAKTSMLIAISDAREHADETFQSLLFGSRAILVKTAPRVNQFFDLSALNERIAQSLQARCSPSPLTNSMAAAVAPPCRRICPRNSCAGATESVLWLVMRAPLVALKYAITRQLGTPSRKARAVLFELAIC